MTTVDSGFRTGDPLWYYRKTGGAAAMKLSAVFVKSKGTRAEIVYNDHRSGAQHTTMVALESIERKKENKQ